MDDQPNQPPPDDSPPTTGEAEVDNLLDQAQSLVDDIASTVGGPTDQPDPDKPPDDASLTVDEPDTSASLEAVEEKLADLDELVGGDTPSEPVPETAEQATPTEDTAATSKASEEAVESPPDSEPLSDSVASSGKQDGDEAAPDVQAPASHPLLGDDGDAAFQGELGSETDFGSEGDLDLGGDADLAEPEPPAEKDDQPTQQNQAESKTVSPPRPVKQRIIDTAEATGRRLRSGVMIAPRAISAILVGLDRPFSRFSPSTKKVIGFIAITTVLMGIISMILPGLFKHNPYESLPP